MPSILDAIFDVLKAVKLDTDQTNNSFHNPDLFPEQIRRLLEPISAVRNPAHQGMTSLVTFVDSALGPVVVKRAAGKRVAALRREHAVLDSLHGLSLPIPEALLYVERTQGGEPEGWLVMNRLPGEPLDHVLHSELPPGARAKLLHSLGRLIAQLHATPAPPGLQMEASTWLDGMLDLAARNLSEETWEGTPESLEKLRQDPPSPVEPVLIHGDLFLDNVLSNGSEVTGLIDWAFGAAGDPRYDLTLAVESLTPEDRKAFFDGYGEPDHLSQGEFDYFINLAMFY